MFRFWSSEARGCDKQTEPLQTHAYDYFGPVPNAYDGASLPAAPAPAGMAAQPTPSAKRKRAPDADAMTPRSPWTCAPSKRIKTEADDAAAAWPKAAFGASYHARRNAARLASPPSPPLSVAPAPHEAPAAPAAPAVDMDEVKDIVQYQFSHEILLKHNEIRLIEQELAKCQIAMEQLRRCHLIPYPTECPTPQQMLDIASGRGAAVRPRPGAAVPKWSSPFGVVDGPYARHYAKWLIPDPVFDGPLPNWPSLAQPAAGRPRNASTAEARAARASISDASKGRPTRTTAGQKLHSLASGYPPAKDRAGPCVLQRSDGKVVKLVCIDCHRDNFSSTQGFINHCRIAHKREFKSHDEAAFCCGHPFEGETPSLQVIGKKNDVAAPGGGRGGPAKAELVASAPNKAAPVPASAPLFCSPAAAPAATRLALAVPPMPGTSSASAGTVHPLASAGSETANALLNRIESSNKAQCRAALGPAETSSASSSPSSFPSQRAFVGSDATPFLSRFLEKKRFAGNLGASVEDAREATDLDAVPWYAFDDAEDEPDSPAPSAPLSAAKCAPARSACHPQASPAFAPSMDGPDGNGDAKAPPAVPRHDENGLYVDDMDVDVDMSPIPSASNNAPSLVSDDGEYDDSDDGSSSEASETELCAVSDVPEINTDEDEDQTHTTPRPLRHHRGSNLKRDDDKHVAFVSPVKGANKGRRN